MQQRAVQRVDNRFVRHTGIAAPFMWDDVQVEHIAALGPSLHDLHGLHTGDPEIRRRIVEPHTHDAVPVDPDAHADSAGEHHVGRQHAFHGFRYRLDGSEDPNFILNQEPYRNASILLAGRNFGQGSLQDFAVVRLMQCGYRVVIAPSFGTVFLDDCFAYGLLPVTVREETVKAIADRVTSNPEPKMTVDLAEQTIERPGMESISFDFDPRRRLNLLRGLDSLDEQLRHADDARSSRLEDRRRRPWIYAPSGNRDP